MPTLGYGLTNSRQLLELAKDVCDVLGHGKYKNAVALLIETCAAETHCGRFADRHPYRLGVSVGQIDQIRFDDIKTRTRVKDRLAIQSAWGIQLKDVELRDLAYSPLLALIFMRLAYKQIPEEIPKTVEGRATYWKDHYNSHHPSAKGDPAEYIFLVAEYARPILSNTVNA